MSALTAVAVMIKSLLVRCRLANKYPSSFNCA
jgi:hypothetical protein